MHIEVKNINYIYDKMSKEKKYALKDISFDIFDNDYIAIIGETGSGKSTLVQHLNGLIKADSGDIKVDGVSIYSKNYNLNSLRFKVGLVFQYPEYQFFSETVLSDVSFGAINMGYSEEEANSMSKNILRAVGIYDECFDKFPFMLSGGEKRKVAIAGVLVMNPEVLILDEPQAGLDPISKIELFKVLDNLHKNGKTIIMITHNMEDVVEYANKVIVMKNSKILRVGETVEVFNDDELLNEANIIKPDQVELIHKLNKKFKNIDKNKIKQEEIVEEIINKIKR